MTRSKPLSHNASRSPLRRPAASALALALTTLGAPPAAAQVQNRCASSDALQNYGNQHSHWPQTDPTGRWMVFHSRATNLVFQDTNGVQDVFLKDFGTGLTERISIGALGQANDDSREPRISGTGRWVVYASDANNLSPFDPNRDSDIYLADRLLQTTELISTSHLGIVGNGPSFHPSVSDDGRYVAFHSQATNLVPGGLPGGTQVFVKDRLTGEVTLCSRTPVPPPVLPVPGNGASRWARISRSGQFVVFASDATDLLPGDTNNRTDVYTYDLSTDRLWRSSLGPGGVEPNGACSFPDIDEFGQTICYESFATNLVPGHGGLGVYVTDAIGSFVQAVNTTPLGAPGNGSASQPAIAGRGRWVVFATSSSDLVAGVGDSRGIVALDRVTGRRVHASVSLLGGPPNGSCQRPTISDDGRFVGYVSAAPNLLPGKVLVIEDAIRADVNPPVVATVTPGGPGCPGSNGAFPVLGAIAGELPWIGFDFHMHGTGAPGLFGIVLIGASDTVWNGVPLPMPLDPLGAPGCALRTSVELSLFTLVDPAVGTWSADLSIPNDIALRGVGLHAQTWLSDPGFNAFDSVVSSALDFTIGG
ncbi:MAG: hypothetical protein AB7O97_06890 [Planctomycetota bacterium]